MKQPLLPDSALSVPTGVPMAAKAWDRDTTWPGKMLLRASWPAARPSQQSTLFIFCNEFHLKNDRFPQNYEGAYHSKGILTKFFHQFEA